MNLLSINGSPRKGGNTEIILSQIVGPAEERGARIRHVTLDTLQFHGCKGCLWCQNTNTAQCVQHDDLMALYDDIAAADALVLASPVYFSTMTAQMKTFMDRLYPFYGRGGKPSRLPKRIRAALVFTQGQNDPALYERSFAIAADAYRLIGFDVEPEVFVAPGIPNKGDVLNRPELLRQARQLGERLV